MEAFIGMIMPWPGTFVPRGWAACNGQKLSIMQNAALYAVIGIQYGGDGVQTFQLPDLRGRTLLGAQGQLPLSSHNQGSTGGAESVNATSVGVTAPLTAANLPLHNHPATMSMDGMSATTAIKVSTGTGGQLLASEGSTLASTQGGASGAAIYQPQAVPQQAPVTLGGVTTTVTGSGSVTVGDAGTKDPVGATVTSTATVPTMMPFLAMNYIICTEGLFPQRN
jgi:microcystin-dependent protein